ncbi:MAG TPA: EAL domain-containing protein [Gammaproteobacteria bacterium]|nr:EAL domain-containing protein [Gammaproteobacteria bacterium]
MAQGEQKLQVKLPARITGLVFWGLVFVGLALAVIVLQQTESRMALDNKRDASLIAYEIEEVIESQSEGDSLASMEEKLRPLINQRLEKAGFHALRLRDGDYTLSIGTVGDKDDVYIKDLSFYPRNAEKPETIRMELYCQGSRAALSSLRKNFLLSIGIGVFIFGMLLQWILQKMLADPFQNMVHTAEQFSRGNEDIRFDESRQDEFGYLGKFINNAIDSILAHKNELLAALKRAADSEKALSHEKERAEVTLYAITDCVITVDVDETILYINPATEKMLLAEQTDVIGRPFNAVFRIVNENTGEKIDDILAQCFRSGDIIQLPEHSSLLTMRNDPVSIEASVAPMKSAEGGLMGAVIVMQDVSHTRRLTRQLSYQASHDMLTGLYNRRKFEEYLEEILLNVREENKQHALLYLDLDNFKIVNDTCGHIAGDELLKQLPPLFHEVMRSGDIIARLGGDEFGVILQNCGLKQAVAIADKIRQKIKAYRFNWNDRTFEIGVSIGVIGINEDNAEMSQVLSAADIACYAAKDSGRNRVHVYEPSDAAVSERHGQMHWTARISRALTEKRFRIFQQPIVGMLNNSRTHVEILLRMIEDNGDIIPPGAFIPAAERYGLMPQIDRWVIDEVFRYMSEDDPADPIQGTDRVFAINLSGDSINQGTLQDYILRLKEKYRISLENVCFEITETVAISNLSKASQFISELKKHGCQFALDDFGSGLSSFAYLKNLPVNYLKIDGAFIRDICSDDIDRTMVESIQHIGKVMGLQTVAEHVEDNGTYSMLRDIGVDYVQGYLLGRPEAVLIRTR